MPIEGLIIGVLTVMLLTVFFFAFLVWGLQRQNRQWTDPSRHVQTDLTSMMILFSTMRDFLSEQKTVATQFNRSLEVLALRDDGLRKMRVRGYGLVYGLLS